MVPLNTPIAELITIIAQRVPTIARPEGGARIYFEAVINSQIMEREDPSDPDSDLVPAPTVFTDDETIALSYGYRGGDELNTFGRQANRNLRLEIAIHGRMADLIIDADLEMFEQLVKADRILEVTQPTSDYTINTNLLTIRRNVLVAV